MTAKVKKIDPRPNISQDIADAVRRMIVTGALYPGQRVNEVHLAADLGVSRTPLREALSALVAEGALDAEPRRGFFVTPLSVEEVRDIYPIRALLDPEALRLAGGPSEATLKKLEDIKNRMVKERRTDKVIDLDDAFHLELVKACPNQALVDLIKQFMRRTRRYEFHLMSTRESVQSAVGNKEKIIANLRKGRLDQACEALRRTLERGKEPIIKWLKEKN